MDDTRTNERLAFVHTRATVPGHVDRPPVRNDNTFATAPRLEARDWGYFGLLAFTAVLLMRPQDQLPALQSLHLADLAALVGIGPMLLHRFANRRPVFRITPEAVGMLALGAVMVATVPFSIWPSGALSTFTDAYLKVVVVFILMMNTLTSPKRLEQVTWLIVVCIGYVAAFALWHYARGMDLVENERLGGPIGGIFGNPNDLALNMVTFLPAAAVIAMARRHTAWRRLAAAGICVLMAATVVFTKSRGGMLGMIAMIATLAFLGGRIRRGFGVVTVAAVLVGALFVPSAYWLRMSSIGDETQDRRSFTGSSEAR